VLILRQSADAYREHNDQGACRARKSFVVH
jgi:hypothetical protein